MLRKMKIGSKTIVTVALLVVGVAAGIGITTYFQARAALGAQVQDTITHQAHEAAILVRSELDKYLLIGRELAENPQIKGMDLPTQLIALEAMTERLGFLGMGIIDSGGTAHYPDGTQAALGDRAYFREAMGGAASFSDVLISRVTNSAVMILAVPILGSGTAPTAVLLIRLDAGWLSEITDRIGYGDGGYAYMIDRTGAFIAHDQRDYVLEQRNFLEEGRTNPDLARLSQMLQRMTQGHAGYDEYVFMGSLQFAGFAPIARSDWSIAIGGYRDRIFRSVDQMRSTTMLIAVFFIVVGVVAAVIFARSISSPINTLVAGADQLSVGDIQVSGVDPKAIARINQRQDELGAIGRAFSGIIEYQRQKVAIAEQIASRNLTVETAVSSDNDTLGKAFSEMVESLNSVLGQVQEAVEQVAAGATQVSTASQDLSQGATESASSLEEITASINQISSQSRQTMDSSAQANKLAQQAATDAQNGQSQMRELRTAMESISESSGEITKIVKVIDDIAFQINLLALNANVEAARAGKYGKGFAVVADEVRNLAVRAADAVKETTGMVERSVHSVQTGDQHTQRTAEQLESIVTGAARVSQFLDELAASSREQSLAIDQITEGLGQVDQVTQSNTASAEQSAAASEELSSQAEELRSAIASFKLKTTTDDTRSLSAADRNGSQKPPVRIALDGDKALDRF